MKTAAPEDVLDLALKGASPGDPSTEDLVLFARELEGLLIEPEAPTGAHERVVFVQGVGAQAARVTPWRFFGPSAVVVSLLLLLGVLSHNAAPGQLLYPVRKVMSGVGLAESPLHEADRRIGSGEAAVRQAEEAESQSPAEADDLALSGITGLTLARELLEDVGSEQARTRLEEIESLEARAKGVIVRVNPEAKDDAKKKKKAKKNSGAHSKQNGKGEETSGDKTKKPDAEGSPSMSEDGRHDEGSDADGGGVDTTLPENSNVQGDAGNTDKASGRRGAIHDDAQEEGRYDSSPRRASDDRDPVRRLLRKMLKKKRSR